MDYFAMPKPSDEFWQAPEGRYYGARTGFRRWRWEIPEITSAQPRCAVLPCLAGIAQTAEQRQALPDSGAAPRRLERFELSFDGRHTLRTLLAHSLRSQAVSIFPTLDLNVYIVLSTETPHGDVTH